VAGGGSAARADEAGLEGELLLGEKLGERCRIGGAGVGQGVRVGGFGEGGGLG